MSSVEEHAAASGIGIKGADMNHLDGEHKFSQGPALHASGINVAGRDGSDVPAQELEDRLISTCFGEPRKWSLLAAV